jgi:hypothetical protein|nr:MAG TPA: hypothetical protein [Caudoviricetes sp.]
MVFSWRNRGENVEILCAIHNCGEIMENLWRFDGGIMESLWNFDGEKPRLEYGETVEHLWRFDTLENHRLENIKTH